MSQNGSEESRKLIMLIVNHISNTTSLHARALNLYSTHFCQDPSVDKGPNIRKDVGRKLRERETGRVERTAGMYYINLLYSSISPKDQFSDVLDILPSSSSTDYLPLTRLYNSSCPACHQSNRLRHEEI